MSNKYNKQLYHYDTHYEHGQDTTMNKKYKQKFYDAHCEHRKETVRKAKPIIDSEVTGVMKTVDIINDSTDHAILFDQFAFLEAYDIWIHTSEKFKIMGLHTFPHRLVTHGITEAFTDFYETQFRANVQVMRGEYTYHRDLGIKVLDDYKDIEANSALIISYPFSATGNAHPDWDRIMMLCNEKNVDVFVDCCLFGVSEVEKLDTTHKCITHVAFSFSKTFGTGGMRTGMLYKRNIDGTQLETTNANFYTQMAGMRLHYKLIKQFSPDYMCGKYRDRQVELCKKLEIEPSDTVLFGISNKEEYDYYERDSYINRICLAYALQERVIAFKDFK